MTAIRYSATRPTRLFVAVCNRMKGKLRTEVWQRAASASILLFGLLLGGSAPLLLLPHSTEAQGIPAGDRAFTNSYARPGRPTMTIYAWGSVGRSGIWRVERDIGIIEFLSAANVPGLGVEQAETRERYLLRIYRGEDDRRTRIYRGELEQVIEESSEVPSLQDGDVLVLERRQERRWSFSRISQYIGTASSLLLLFLRLRNLN